MNLVKSGYAKRNAALPEICLCVAYFPDKTYQMYSRDGDSWNPVNNVDESKWKECDVPKETADVITKAAGAKECQFFELTPEARQRKGTGFTA